MKLNSEERELLDDIKKKFYDAVEAKREPTQKHKLWLAYFKDRQYMYYSSRKQAFVEPDQAELARLEESRKKIRIQINMIKPAVMTVVSYQTKQAPKIYVRPGSSTTERSKAVAKVGTAILDYERNMNEYIITNTTRAYWQTICGKAYKITYPEYPEGFRKVVETTPEGIAIEKTVPVRVNIKNNVITPLEAYPEPGVQKIDDMNWFIWARNVPRSSIIDAHPKLKDVLNKDAFRSNRLDNELEQSTEERGDVKTVIEYWEKPSRNHKRGRHLVICDDHILFQGEHPNWDRTKDGGEVWGGYRIVSYDYIPGLVNHFGAGLVSPAAPIQKACNGIYSALLTQTVATSAPHLCIQKGSIKSKISFGQLPDSIEFDMDKNPPKWLDPPTISPALLGMLNKLEEKMHQVTGVHPISQGEMPQQRVSGTALIHMVDVDVGKFAPILENDEECERRNGYYILQAYKQFAPQRIIEILPPEMRGDIVMFLQDDLRDNDVVVERGSSTPENRAGQMQLMSDLLQYGGIKLDNPLKEQKFIASYKQAWGDSLVSDLTGSVQLAEAENKLLLNGQPIPVLASQNHDLHLQIHNTLYDSPQTLELLSNMPVRQALDQHRIDHLQALSDLNPVPQPMMPPGPGGPEGEQPPMEPQPEMAGMPSQGLDQAVQSIFGQQGQQAEIPPTETQIPQDVNVQ
jgi:hypothetical protein